MSSHYYSRDGNSDSFESSYPNTNLKIVPLNGGQYLSFTSPESGWSGGDIEDGQLMLATGEIATLSNNITTSGSYAIRMKVMPSQNASIALQIGNFELLYNLISGQCTGGNSGDVVTSASTNAYLARDLLVIVFPTSVYSYVDGGVSCIGSLTDMYAGEIQLEAQESAVYIDDFLLLQDPIVTIEHYDGLGRVIQAQTLDDTQSNTISSELIYDGWGNPSVTTKIAVKENTVFSGYQTDFVTDFAWDTGILSGDVADYYKQGGGGYSSANDPDDYQYAYSQQSFSADPLHRLQAVGFPGNGFIVGSAMQDSFGYTSSNESDDLLKELGLSGVTDNYRVNSKVQPFNSSETITATDIIAEDGDVIASQINGPANAIATSSFDYAYQSDGGLQITNNPPNYYNPPFGQTDGNYSSSMLNNYQRQLTFHQHADYGPIRMVSDHANRPLFVMDGNGSHTNTIVYYQYDNLGRITEEGSYSGYTWDDLTSTIDINNPTYPDSWTQTPFRQYVYDIDDKNATTNLKGRLYKTTTVNEDGSQVVETFTYDRRGNIVSSAITVDTFDDTTRSTNYTYNNLNSVLSIEYADSSTITYSYNNLGQLESIKNGTNEYASYLYNPDGSLSQALLNNQSVQRTYTYDFRNRLLGISDEDVSTGSDLLFQESLSYDSNPSSYTDGATISQVSYSGSGVPTSYTVDYFYDAFRQLTQAEVTPNGSVPNLNETFTYDLNGNMKSYNGTDINYYDNTNRLKNTDGSTDADYNYDDGNTTGNGNITATEALSGIQYSSVTNLTTSITTPNETVTFAYDGDNKRALKSSSASKTLYIYGSSFFPLMEEGSDGSSLSYIYGPTGMLAINDGSNDYFISQDHLGSTRAVFDSSNTIQANFIYSAFGNLDTDNSSTGSITDMVRYRYTGQEYDAETGLYNYRARMYDPSIGRFYAPDPAEQYASPYEYAGNNPINEIDPTGTIALGLVAMGLRLASTAAWLGYSIYSVAQDPSDASAWVNLAIAVAAGAMESTQAILSVRSARQLDSVLNEMDRIPCGSSFADGTEIATDKGQQAIEDLEVGDMVWAYDAEDDTIDLFAVNNVFQRTANEIIILDVDGELIETTPEHPFYEEKKGWTRAENLQVGDLLRTRERESGEVRAISRELRKEEVYNFEVDQAHTYFVSKTQLLVHNIPCDISEAAQATIIDDANLLHQIDPAGRRINLQVHPESLEILRRGIPNNYFTGVVDLEENMLHLRPLVPAFGDPPYPIQAAQELGIEPITHVRDINPSHLQLANIIREGEPQDFVGFTLLKVERGRFRIHSFTSRSLNLPKFRERGPNPIANNLPPQPGQAGPAIQGANPNGRVSRNWALLVLWAFWRA